MKSSRWRCVLAGLEAGTVGVLTMLAWLGAASVLYRHSFWTSANLMATNLYGTEAVRAGFGWRSLAGIAIYLLLYGLIGAGFALAAGRRVGGVRSRLFGLATGLVLYFVLFRAVWPHVSPLLVLYTHDGPMLAGHLMYGLLLGRYREYLRALDGAEPPPPQVPDAAVDDSTVSSSHEA